MTYCVNIIAAGCEQHSHCKTYNTLVRHYFGSRVGLGFEVVLILYLFGSCIGYMIIVYDMFQPVAEKLYSDHYGSDYVTHSFYKVVIKNNAFTSRACIIGVFAGTMMLPLSYLRKISMLQFTSTLAVVAVVYMSCLVSVKSLYKIIEEGFGPNVDMFNGTGLGVATAVPIICFAFQCQINVPPIYAEMKKDIRNASVFRRVAAYAYAICLVLYVPCGVTGYLYFGQLTQSDILKGNTMKPGERPNGFDTTAPMLIARVCIMMAVICCYPLNHYPARCALYSLLFGDEAEFRPRGSMTTPELPRGADKESHPTHDTPRWNRYFYIETTLWVAINFIIAVVVTDLSYIMDICGSICATIVIFIIPAQFLRVASEGSTPYTLLSHAILVLGVTIMVVCFTTIMLRIAGVVTIPGDGPSTNSTALAAYSYGRAMFF